MIQNLIEECTITPTPVDNSKQVLIDPKDLTVEELKTLYEEIQCKKRVSGTA